MNPVIQEEKTGCGIAASAVIAGVSYQQAKKVANQLNIYADDKNLWSDTQYVRQILSHFGIQTGDSQIPFSKWESLPDRALLAIKWKLIHGKAYWHWVVFEREGTQARVLDSNRKLKSNIRVDYARMRPKWFIAVY